MRLLRADIEAVILAYLSTLNDEISITSCLSYLSQNKCFTTRPTVVSILNEMVDKGSITSEKRKVKNLVYLFYRKI